MIVSGSKDYRVEYRNSQVWLLPRYVVLILFSLGVLLTLIGIIFLGVGILTIIGVIFLGLGLSLLLICILLCIHAYCIRYIRDEETQTKDEEARVKEGTLSAYPLVTSKPPQGVLKTGRSPILGEPKRVRLQAERDTGFSTGQSQSGQSQSGQSQSGQSQSGQSQSGQSQSGQSQSGQSQSGQSQSGQSQSGQSQSGQSQSGQSQSGQTQVLSSYLLSEKFPLRTPDLREESASTKETKVVSSNVSAANVENHYETLPLRTDSQSSTLDARRPGEVFTRSQEADVSRQMSSTQVVYPQQVGPMQSTLRHQSTPPSQTQQFQSTTIRSTSTPQSTTVLTHRSGSPTMLQDPNPSILKSPFPLASNQYRQQASEQHFQTSSRFETKAEPTGQQYGKTGPRISTMSQQYHTASESRPVKIEQYYGTFPQQANGNQRQMATEYHWSEFSRSAGSKEPMISSGQDMSFEDHRSSKMSLYDNLNDFPEGGRTI